MKHSACLDQVKKLIAFGEDMIAKPEKTGTTEHSRYGGGGEVFILVHERRLNTWLTSCQALVQSLGEKGIPWETAFNTPHVNSKAVQDQLGSLEGIKYALENGLFSEIEDFVRADLFSDMLEQSEYLFTEGFHVASGVVARSVFEEHLRKKCTKLSCLPIKQKAMLGDYISELEKSAHVDRIGITKFRAMATVGNAVAHGKPPVTPADIEGMIRDIRDVLFRYPV